MYLRLYAVSMFRAVADRRRLFRKHHHACIRGNISGLPNLPIFLNETESFDFLSFLLGQIFCSIELYPITRIPFIHFTLPYWLDTVVAACIFNIYTQNS